MTVGGYFHAVDNDGDTVFKLNLDNMEVEELLIKSGNGYDELKGRVLTQSVTFGPLIYFFHYHHSR